MGQHEVPTAAEQTFRAGFLAAIPGFLTTLSPPSGRDFRVRAHGHGAEQGLEESGSGEFAGIADDQPSLACDEIKVGQARPRAVGG